MDFFRRRSSSQSGGSLRPTRRRDQIAAIFSRSRSPSRSPSHAEHNNVAAFAANQAVQASWQSSSPEPHDSTLLTVDIPQSLGEKDTSAEQSAVKSGTNALAAPQVIVTEVPDFNDEKLDLPTSAYEKALSSLDDGQRQKIKDEETIRGLFEQLNQADKGHSERSLLRRGLSAVKPYLERMNATIDFISPFASMEPAVGSALGLVKGASSIAIAICGRFDDMTKDIAGFLERIPAIDRCSDVARDGRLPEIHKALVSMYTDLLLFYLRTVEMFEESRFVLHVAMDALKPAISEVVSSFKTHADLLSKLLEAESFASIQEIKDEQVEALIRDTLDRNRENQWSYHNELKRRANAACKWITSDDSFSYWMLNARDSNLLALFGDMGCGKTTMAAFVADTLAQGGRPLCAYYCKDEHEAAKLGNIYRSILLQFLRRKPSLKQRFWDWHKRTSPHISIDPTQSDEKLREFLFEIISSSREAVFIVLDALDECKAYPRKQLFSLFSDLFQNKARLKVFVSLRFDEEIEAELPLGVTRIELRPDRERDRAIAAYLADQMNLRADFQPRVVEELTAKSHGSAIWLRIAIEYMAKSRINNERGLEMTLEKLPSSKGLTELYGKLFDRICEDDVDRTTLLQRALETLAVACRPLTQEELAYAVFIMNPIGEDATTLADVDELANSVDLLSMIRPFVSASSAQNGRSPRLRLVHLSLKDLLLRSPPSEWCSAKAVAMRKKGGRTEELEAGLLRSCIEYLLLDECSENKLSLEWADESDQAGLFAVGDVFDDEPEARTPKTPTSVKTTLSQQASDIFDPSELGFGNFFAYAAAFWTYHFGNVKHERRPNPEDLTILCQKDSQRMDNWVQQWRRPNCCRIPEVVFPADFSNLDPLVIAALFGPTGSITDLLSLDFDEGILAEDSVWTATDHLIRRGHITAVRELVHDRRFRQILCSCKFLYKVLPVWILRPLETTDWGSSQTPGDPEWESIFAFIIRQLREDLLDAGNDLLRRAASCGCLVFIRKLFEATQADPELHRAVVTPEVRQRAGKSRGYLADHQSIGQAAYEGRTDIVRFLCETPGLGLESHLHYVSDEGRTVFHHAARSRQTEVFRILLRHWPEGVHIRDNVGDTPLNLLVFSSTDSSTAEDRDVMLVRLLIHEGKADATGRHENPGYAPLCLAARGGCIKLLRVLVTEGNADISQVVDVDEATGRPFLIPGMDALEDVKKKDRVLKELCSMIPLAVSMEYLV